MKFEQWETEGRFKRLRDWTSETDLVLAFDPGGTTGLAVFDFQSMRLLGFGFFPPRDIQTVLDLIESGQVKAVVYERFSGAPQVIQISRDIIREIESAGYAGKVFVYVQLPALRNAGMQRAKALTDLSEREARGGFGHALDAVAHGIVWFQRRVKEQWTGV